jgi:transglutaminase-like putative cysteine protease
MPDARGRIERGALAGLIAACAFSTAVAGSVWIAPLAAAVAVLGSRLGGPGAVSMMRGLRMAGDFLVAATGVFGVIWTLYPVVPEDTLRRIAVPLTLALAALSLAGLAAAREFPPARTLLPSALAMLVLGGLLAAPGPRFPACLAAAALCSIAYVLCERRASDRREILPRLAALGGFAVGVALLGVAIARFLPWAQPLVENATFSLIAEGPSTASAGFSETSRLGDIEELALSRKMVLRAFTDTPQRLRGRVYTRFDGRAWALEPARSGNELPVVEARGLAPPLPRFFDEVPGGVHRAEHAPADAALVRTRIVLATSQIPTLLAPLAPVLVGVAKTSVRLDAHGILATSPPGSAPLYAIANRYGGPAPGDAEPELTLQLPAASDPRLAELARTLGGTEGGAEDKVRRTLFHLERCCRYSLKVPRPTTRDPVAGFLFESRKGYCEYFASAAAILLRLQGLPTRYVTGFNVRDESLAGGHYAVRESDAHAWIESHIPGSGWLEFDPTPSAQFAAVHDASRPGALARLLERLFGLVSELGARARSGSFAASLRWALRGLAPLALAAGSLLGLVLLRRLRGRALVRPVARSEDVDPRVALLLLRVDRALA